MLEEGFESFETEIDVVDWRGHARVPGVGRGVEESSGLDLVRVWRFGQAGQGEVDRGRSWARLVDLRSRLPRLDLCLYGQGDVGPSLGVDSSSSTRRKYPTETTNKILQQPDVSL